VTTFWAKQKDLLDAFYGMELYQVLELYSFSVLRIIHPTLVPLKDSFILYSGITNSAPAICKILTKSFLKTLNLEYN